VAVVVLGGLLRLYRYTALSLWVDEGITIGVSRLPWPDVLGLHGAYEVHPPLYFALTKAMSLLAPEAVAGRLVSVVAGTLTIAVVYFLMAWLVQPWAGVGAALVLAVAPLHIWYSQEGRPYALMVLLIALSYLALVAYVQTGRRGWVPVYALAVLASVYTEYSAIYALLPQGLLLAYLLLVPGTRWGPNTPTTNEYGAINRAATANRAPAATPNSAPASAPGQERRRAGVLIAAAGCAALAFLPWLPQLLHTAASGPNKALFAVTPARVASSLLSLIGVAEPLSQRGTAAEAAASLSAGDLALYGVLVLAVTPAALAGVVALARRSRLGLPLALALLAGTIVTGVALSLIFPGYAKRTVLAGVLGWALLIGAALFAAGLSRRLKALTLGSTALALLIAGVTLAATYQNGDKQHWRDLAAATMQAQAASGTVVTYPTVAATLIGVYEPVVIDRPHVAIRDGGRLPALTAPGGGRPDRVWLAYLEFQGIDAVRADLAAQGYVRRRHTAYPDLLYLDLYIRSVAGAP
jgi:4-amino-4-deoxy-L-arabinose transferase-like glycosyltransferase